MLLWKLLNTGLGGYGDFHIIFQLYRGSQFYWWRKPEYPEKTTDLSAANHRQTLSHNAVSSTPYYERDSNSQLITLDTLLC